MIDATIKPKIVVIKATFIPPATTVGEKMCIRDSPYINHAAHRDHRKIAVIDGKVATEIATKGYCSTKNMYYFGLKLHTLAFRREGTIPVSYTHLDVYKRQLFVLPDEHT